MPYYSYSILNPSTVSISPSFDTLNIFLCRDTWVYGTFYVLCSYCINLLAWNWVTSCVMSGSNSASFTRLDGRLSLVALTISLAFPDFSWVEFYIDFQLLSISFLPNILSLIFILRWTSLWLGYFVCVFALFIEFLDFYFAMPEFYDIRESFEIAENILWALSCWVFLFDVFLREVMVVFMCISRIRLSFVRYYLFRV